MTAPTPTEGKFALLHSVCHWVGREMHMNNIFDCKLLIAPVVYTDKPLQVGVAAHTVKLQRPQ